MRFKLMATLALLSLFNWIHPHCVAATRGDDLQLISSLKPSLPTCASGS